MAVLPNTITTADVVKESANTFAKLFGKNIAGLQKILGVTRKMPKAQGSAIDIYKSTVTLAGGTVAEGEIIPLSHVKKELAETKKLVWDKRAKLVTGEAIHDVGITEAIVETDSVLVTELQKNLRKALFDNLANGTGSVTGQGLKKAMAQAYSAVQKVFEDDGVESVAIINSDDLADYLGDAEITMQKEFGLNYLKGFMNFDTVIVTNQIAKGTMYATASQNLVLAYVDMRNSAVNDVFNMVTDNLGIIGISHDLASDRFSYLSTFVSGTLLFAENLSGVIKGTITSPAV